nr:hypothetical protein [Tanacetum cinerariifolium]
MELFQSPHYSSDSSSGHSLPGSFVDAPGSHKRCRSPVVLVSLATPVPGALSPIHANLLPPCKRIRGVVDIDVDTAATKAAAARYVDVGVEASIGNDGEDKAKEEAKSGDRGTIEIEVNRVLDIESAQIEQEHRTLAASEQRTDMLARIRVLERDNMRLLGMLCV